jgi:PAS domain S-box-containing protein
VNQIDKKPEDLLGKNWREAGIPEELGRSWDRALRSVFKTGKPTAMETAIDAKHRRVVLDWRFFPEFDKSGKVETVIGTAHDITLKKELADALKESEERFSIAFSLNPAPTLITTIDEGRITNVNDVWLETMGYSPEEVLGRTTIELSLWETPDDRNRYIKLLNEKGSVENELFRLRTESGEMRDILLSAQPVLINGEGMLLSVCYDITERKKIEEALRDSEERYRNLFEENHSSMLLVDPEDGSIVDANPAACSFYRYSREEITRMNVADINMLARDELFREMERANSEKRKVFVFRHRLADGEIRDVDVYSGPIKLHGNPLLLSTIHDITERKRSESAIMRLTEELRESNKELEAFTYSVSHDLRAPIRIMKGYARMVMKDFGIATGEEVQRRLSVIQDSAIKMGELVEALLNLSRAGRTALSPTNLDMKKIIGDAWNEIRTLNPGRNIEFILKKLPSAVGDPSLIRQVVYNLLSNAVKYTKNREKAVVEVGGYIEEEQSIFCVKDNGAGFDMHYYDKLFGVFQRLHSVSEYEGVGVGLSIVQRVVTRHGGRSWAEGKVDQGATFYFSLPASAT